MTLGGLGFWFGFGEMGEGAIRAVCVLTCGGDVDP